MDRTMHRKRFFILVKEDTTHTIGAEFGSKLITLGDQSVKLQIWDVRWSSAHSLDTEDEKKMHFAFRRLAKNVFDLSHVVIIEEHLALYLFMTYPSRWKRLNFVTHSTESSSCHCPSRDSYNAITNWLTDARSLASENLVIILCGNKKDLEDQRQVTFLEGSRFAQEQGRSDFFKYLIEPNDGMFQIWCFSRHRPWPVKISMKVSINALALFWTKSHQVYRIVIHYFTFSYVSLAF